MCLLSRIRQYGTLAAEQKGKAKWFNKQTKSLEPEMQIQYKTPKDIYHDHAVDELYQQIITQRINNEKTID